MNQPEQPRTPDNPYRYLVEQVKDYAIFMLDLKGYIMTWNQGARRLKGYEAEEIIGKHFSTFYPQVDIDNEKPAFELNLASELGRYEDEGWRVRKDGTRFWANVIITALRNDQGELIGFGKVTRDLTQQKIQDDHLRKLLDSEERFRLLVEQVKDYAIFMLDARGNISSWNQGARRLKGYSADEIIGKHFSIFYTAEDLASDKPGREISTAIREGRYEEEGWRVRKDGTLFWASVVLTSLWDKRGNLTGFAKVTRDLTERKKQDEAIKARTAELETFSHTISHDLRAPLRAIKGYSEVLLSEFTSEISPGALNFVERIDSSARSMEELIRGILSYSRVSTIQYSPQEISLQLVLEEVLKIHEAEIQQAKAEVRIDSNLPTLKANRTLLVQIFSNLIGNAIKFGAKDRPPVITIDYQPRSNEACLLVSDNGVGVQEKDLGRIFKVFERGSADAKIPGTGLGLAIVQRAVERLGGSIQVTSVVGRGTTFTLCLPLGAANSLLASNRDQGAGFL